MSRALEYPYTVQGRLGENDYEQFRGLLRKTGKSASELARELIHSSLVEILNKGGII